MGWRIKDCAEPFWDTNKWRENGGRKIGFHFAFILVLYVVLYNDSQSTAVLTDTVWNRNKFKTHDQYARGTTKHTTAVQGGFLSGFLCVITETTRLASLVLYFLFQTW